MKWSGDWSDDSPLWSQYPGVAFEIGRKHKEDGIFWISWYAHGIMMMMMMMMMMSGGDYGDDDKVMMIMTMMMVMIEQYFDFIDRSIFSTTDYLLGMTSFSISMLSMQSIHQLI